MDNSQISNPLLIEHYLNGELGGEEEAAFEEMYLSSPALLDQLEAAFKLRQGLNDLSRAAEDTKPNSGYPPAGGSHSTVARLLQTPRFAIAASVFLLIGLTATSTLFYFQDELTDAPVTGTALNERSGPFALTPGEDLSEQPALFNRSTGELLVAIKPETRQNFHSFNVRISRLEEASAPGQVLKAEGLVPDNNSYLRLQLEPAQLATGNYEVSVSGRTAPVGNDAAEYEHISDAVFELNWAPN